MSVYADYTPEEQQQLRAGIQAAAVAVSAASPGRKEETVSEGYAAAKYVLESRPAYVANTLVTSIIVEIETRLVNEQPFPDYLAVATAPEARESAFENLRRAAVLVDAKAPAEEGAGYRQWLFEIAQVTAEAGKEDQGFLAMGGVLINDTERAALQEIAGILGIES